MRALFIILFVSIAFVCNAQKPLSTVKIDMVTLNEAMAKDKPGTAVEVIGPTVTDKNKERAQAEQRDKTLDNVVTRSGCIIVIGDIQASKEQLIWYYFGISYWVDCTPTVIPLCGTTPPPTRRGEESATKWSRWGY